jgi:hypothetical protein
VLYIPEPSLGLLDLSQGQNTEDLAEDKAMLEPLFSSVTTSSAEIPKCDVLFVYGTVDKDGNIVGSTRNLATAIRESWANIAVVATGNKTESYIAACQSLNDLNLVMTLSRNGDAFPNFFSRLFSAMHQGISMPVAWNKIAPQGIEHAVGANIVFVCGAGQVAFGAAPKSGFKQLLRSWFGRN